MLCRNRNILLCKIILFYNAWTTLAASDFKIYWNIPSFMCKKHQVTFENLAQEFGIIQNQNDSFRGDKISILYDPGEFPAILQNTTSKEFFYRNHGVPPEGNLTQHLDLLKKQVVELIPDSNFSGIAIVDFESWRPIYRQNFGTLKPYKTLSMQIEQKKHPRWSKRQVEKEARHNFEVAAKSFMLESLKVVENIRPNAKWGYYAFPYCFNGNGVDPARCSDGVKEENDMIQWMFNSSGAIYPSVYLQERLSPEKRIPMVKGRVTEAIRVANSVRGTNSKPQVLVYHRYVYTDTLKYIETKETFNVLSKIKQLGANGAILWGSSYDLNTLAKCQEFETYVKNKLGPAIRMLNAS